MADFKKLKNKSRRNALGGAKPPSEGSGATEAPETAPAAPESLTAAEGHDDAARVDGRSLRATGRTESFATRVSAGFRPKLIAQAEREGRPMNAILEDALERYIAQHSDG